MTITEIRRAAAIIAEHYLYITELRWNAVLRRECYEVRRLGDKGLLWVFDTHREARYYGLKVGIHYMRLAKKNHGFRGELQHVLEAWK